MALPRFSDMLVARRRELGLTIAQASKVLKLKEQVLEAFEEGDFANIPKSGYAQGMLSSYARYLGLNPREVVDQFQEDLYEHSYGTSSHELRRRTRASRTGDVATSNRSQQTQRPSSTGHFTLSEGPTGRLSTYPDFEHETSHYFDTTSTVHSRGNRRLQSIPLVNSREVETSDLSSVGTRRYTSRVPQSSSSRVPPRGSIRTPDDTAAIAVRAQDRQAGYRAGDVYTRNSNDFEYVDDLVYDEETLPYEAASSAAGRRSSRYIASTERPNVQRSSLSSNRRQLAARRNQRNESTRSGILGTLENFFSDPRRASVVVLALVAIILTILIISSVRSCASARMGTGRQVVAGDTDTPITQTVPATDQGDPQTTEPATPDPVPITETNVLVSLVDGGVSWIEIECDGTSVVADTLTGPWEQSFVVKQGINVQVSDTTVVTVTRNGEQVQFSTKASGVGSLYIEGTDPDSYVAPSDTDSGDAQDTSADEYSDESGES